MLWVDCHEIGLGRFWLMLRAELTSRVAGRSTNRLEGDAVAPSLDGLCLSTLEGQKSDD